MPILTLTATTREQLIHWLHSDTTLVACLCAAWCDVCRDYRANFDQLAAQYSGCNFVWIDIEDHADLVGDIDVDNFPTLLIQRGPHVTFFGSVQPSVPLAARLIQAQLDKSTAELVAELSASAEKQRWQIELHLAHRLATD